MNEIQDGARRKACFIKHHYGHVLGDTNFNCILIW